MFHVINGQRVYEPQAERSSDLVQSALDASWEIAESTCPGKAGAVLRIFAILARRFNVFPE